MRINDGVADGANQPAPAPIHEQIRELSDIAIPRFDYDSKRVDAVCPGYNGPRGSIGYYSGLITIND